MAEFTKVLPASSLDGSGLALPHSFRDAVVKSDGHFDFSLRNAAGQQWPCSIIRKVTGTAVRADITGGWKQYAVANGFQPGDEVVCRHLGGKVLQIVPTGKKGVLKPRAPRGSKKAASEAADGGEKTPKVKEVAAATKKKKQAAAAKSAGSSAAKGGAKTPASKTKKVAANTPTSKTKTPAAKRRSSGAAAGKTPGTAGGGTAKRRASAGGSTGKRAQLKAAKAAAAVAAAEAEEAMEVSEVSEEEGQGKGSWCSVM